MVQTREQGGTGRGMTMTRIELLTLIEDHCAARGETTSRFGRRVLRDPCFVGDLATLGREPRPRTVERVLAGMIRQDHYYGWSRPGGAQFPRIRERPVTA